jgi:hypothetical protein
MPHIYLESHGVRLDVEVQDEALVSIVEPILPPGWQRSQDFPEDGHLTIGGNLEQGYDVHVDGEPVITGQPKDIAVHVLDAQIRARVALLAPALVFVHAGVVTVEGRAIVLPASNFAGKSTLVAALVRAGATYYSDEFAVLDADGCIRPYPRPLSLREPDHRWGEYNAPENLGGHVGGPPVRAALIVETRYEPGARWESEELGAGAGALALVVNAVPIRSRSEEVMRTAGRAAAGTRTLRGVRGEAAETAQLLLDELRGSGNVSR